MHYIHDLPTLHGHIIQSYFIHCGY
jgi:hypothetical protein